MKQRIPNTIYSKEFREQAVKQVTEEGLSPKEAAWRLSMPVPHWSIGKGRANWAMSARHNGR